MLATARTCAVVGLDGYIVQVEVDISPGLPAFKMEGLQNHRRHEKRTAWSHQCSARLA